MNASHRFVALTLAAFFVFTSVQAADTDWHWVRVEPPGADANWEVLQGTASVEFDGEKFTATLTRHTDKVRYDFAIKGTIRGTQVTATETRLGSDERPKTYWGQIQRERTPENAASRGWGFDRITMQSGPWFIGLYREVHDPK